MDQSSEGINNNEFNVHMGTIKEGVPMVRFIGGSEDGVTFRDPLLAPDFFGQYLRRNIEQKLDEGLASVLGLPPSPFYLQHLEFP